MGARVDLIAPRVKRHVLTEGAFGEGGDVSARPDNRRELGLDRIDVEASAGAFRRARDGEA